MLASHSKINKDQMRYKFCAQTILKRGLHGTYVSVGPFHLHRYISEQAFRFNNRATKHHEVNDADRFRLVTSQVAGKCLTYQELTGKVGKPREDIPF